MTAKEYIIANGGKWPDEIAAINISGEVRRRTAKSPIVARLEESVCSAEFARVLMICGGCNEYVASGHTCKGCNSCGGASIRHRWASNQGCPQGKWTS